MINLTWNLLKVETINVCACASAGKGKRKITSEHFLIDTLKFRRNNILLYINYEVIEPINT